MRALAGAVFLCICSAGALNAGVADVRLKGYVGTRLDAMIARHLEATDVFYLTAPFLEKTERIGCWQTEFWGKYMHSAVPLAAYSGFSKIASDVESGVSRILSSQEPSGYIGNYPERRRCGEGWDVWGMKYTLMGLLHYYDGTRLGSKAEVARGDHALEAARRLCDYVIAEIGPNGKRGCELWQTGNWSGYASSSILEPVVWLYRRTKDRKYLDFASYVVRGMTEAETGPRLLDLAVKGVSVADRDEDSYDANGKWAYVCKHGRCKAYEMMSCYQGILDYVEEMTKTEGEDERWSALRRAAVMTAEDIVREEVNLAGGCTSSEIWFHGRRKQHLPCRRLQETCVTVTWMRLCQKLLEMTDDPKWADQMERTFYNAYLGAMKPDGSSFAGYTPLTGYRWHGQHHCFMHWDCCSANGPRGFLCFLEEFCRRKERTVTFNFYGSALVKGFEMYSLYPRQNDARIVSHAEGRLNVRLRMPSWSSKPVVKLNGKALSGARPGAYFSIDRTWALGDVVEVAFDMPVVAHVLGHCVAFTRGPVLLARDSRLGGGDLSEPFSKCMAEGESMPTFVAVRTPSDDFWMTFAATLPIGQHRENPDAGNPETVLFCDYASAGNAWRKDNYYRTWFPVEYGPRE
ncbi:MAG: glycoside hydrolase family 127 protein [bacterium]|nr:glycoside hydrolase family 127 protein [Candidatus Colisoma equi]